MYLNTWLLIIIFVFRRNKYIFNAFAIWRYEIFIL